jgi:hypothetical protein
VKVFPHSGTDSAPEEGGGGGRGEEEEDKRASRFSGISLNRSQYYVY